jgi:hypothetical protein
VKNHKITQKSTITNTVEEINKHQESSIFWKKFDAERQLINYQILLNKIIHRFPVTTKLFTG